MANTQEKRRTLPAGHPRAGYVSPDLSFQDATGTLPEEEQDWHDERDAAREEEAEAVAVHEDKVAKEEAEEAGGETRPAATAKTTAKSETT